MDDSVLNAYDFIGGVNLLREAFSRNPNTGMSSSLLDYDQPNFFLQPASYFNETVYEYGRVNENYDDSSDEEIAVYGHDGTLFNNTTEGYWGFYFADEDSDSSEENEEENMNTDDDEGDGEVVENILIISVQRESVGTQIDRTLVKDDTRELNVQSVFYCSDKFSMSQCSICIADFKNDDKVCELTCKHLFHEECIKEWIKHKPECALCRREVSVK